MDLDTEVVTPERMWDMAENKGLAYAITNHYGKVVSTDKVAEKLWNDAYDSFNAIEKYLEQLSVLPQ